MITLPPGWDAERVEEFRGAFMEFLGEVKVNSKELGQITLADYVYRAQDMALDGIFDGLQCGVHDFKILKSRQLGISTIIRALTLFWCGIHDGLKGYMIFDTTAHMEEARLELIDMLDNLPEGYEFPRKRRENRTLLQLSNKSQIIFATAGTKATKNSGTLGRSLGISFVHASEMCSWENVEGLEAFKNALAEDNPNRLYIWESPLALDTPVPIPKGWTTIGKVKEGDHVYDENGKLCRVVGLSPIFVNRKCYRINFSNGESIVADGVHKWQVMERRWPNNPQWKTKTVTTEQLDLENHRIEAAKPLDMPDTWLPVDPYLLGVWLGDGLTAQTAITTGDEDEEEIRALLTERGCVLGPSAAAGVSVKKFTVLGQRQLFTRLGLLGNKHIPSAYLRASERQRRELLAGLMDTDGHISKTNFRCEFANTSPRLVDDVADLLASLGIKYSRSVFSEEGKLRAFPNGRTYACAQAERLRFCESPDKKVFNLSRKRLVQNAERGFTERRAKYIKIVSIEEVPSVPVRCLSVDSPSHLFLVGKTMIPTHNTARGFNMWNDMWQEALRDPAHQRTIFIGWWAKDNQRIPRNHPDFERYGLAEPTPNELKRIAAVVKQYGWKVDQEQLAWYRRKMDPSAKREGDAEANFDGTGLQIQEQPWTEEEAWQVTGATFFPPEKLTEIETVHVSKKFKTYSYAPGIEFTDCRIYPAFNARSVELKVWEPPEIDGAVYVIAADPAFGANEKNDRSAIQVLRCYADGCDQVAEYAWPLVNTRQFAWVIMSLCGWYGGEKQGNEVYLIVELNGPGQAVWNEINSLKAQLQYGYQPKEVEERGLRNIYQNVRNYIYGRSDSLSPGKNWQWKTSPTLKVGLMERLRDFMSNGMLMIRSHDTVQEMKSVTREGDSIAAQGNKKDDRVLALAFGIRCWEDRVRKQLMSAKRTRASEMAKKRIDIRTQISMFNGNQIDTFFAVKRIARAKQEIAARRLGWRHGHRRF